MKSLAILGAGGHGKVIADAALCAGWEEIVFFDDKWPELKQVGIWKVVGDISLFLTSHLRFNDVIIAFGNNLARFNMVVSLAKRNISLATVIHPSAVVSRFSTLGPGSVVFAGAIINPDSHLGMGCIVNTAATIDHDCKLGHAVHISPGAHLAGNVHVGDLTWVGIGAAVRQQIKIGTEVMVGAGSVVVKNVPSHCTVMGVPARILPGGEN